MFVFKAQSTVDPRSCQVKRCIGLTAVNWLMLTLGGVWRHRSSESPTLNLASMFCSLHCLLFNIYYKSDFQFVWSFELNSTADLLAFSDPNLLLNKTIKNVHKYLQKSSRLKIDVSFLWGISCQALWGWTLIPRSGEKWWSLIIIEFMLAAPTSSNDTSHRRNRFHQWNILKFEYFDKA